MLFPEINVLVENKFYYLKYEGAGGGELHSIYM